MASVKTTGITGGLGLAILLFGLGAARSVSGKCEHAPSRPAPPAKNGQNLQVVPREARLLGAREALLRRAPSAPAVSTTEPEPAQITWTFDRLDSIGGIPTRVEGHPKVIDSPAGKAVEFNGVDDALFIDRHPLAGAATFTFEAIFRPDGGNDFAQRWFHLAERDVKTGLVAPDGYPQNPDTNSRFLFELRTKDGQWWLDAFVTGVGYRSLLLFEDKKHPVGRWYHVAQTYDGTMHRSYVNGVLQGELALSAYKPMGPGAASVGTRINRVNYFKGAVRQARFTPRALTPDQFLKLDIF